MDKQVVILGAGIAGLGAAYQLGNKAIIYEKNNYFGGLCNSFNINGYTFDTAIHLSFTNNSKVRNIFDRTLYNKITPNPMNYYYGNWTKHPIQDNLYFLSDDDKKNAVLDFINKSEIEFPQNYEEYLYSQYGKFISEKFMAQYTKKYWCTQPENMSTEWIGMRMFDLSIEGLLNSIFTQEGCSKYYAKEMRYPVSGGYKSFLKPMADLSEIAYEKNLVEIDLKRKVLSFADGSNVYFNKLISSIPLPKLINKIKDVPNNIIMAAEKLHATSVILVSIGFKHKIQINNLWCYIYDEDIPFCRMYFPHLKSVNNVPKGTSSVQCEIYYDEKCNKSYDLDCIGEKVVEKLVYMGICSYNDIEFADVRKEKYANVVFDSELSINRRIVRDYINNIGIELIGRFGEWEYYWSDQSLLSGVNKAKYID